MLNLRMVNFFLNKTVTFHRFLAICDGTMIWYDKGYFLQTTVGKFSLFVRDDILFLFEF